MLSELDVHQTLSLTEKYFDKKREAEKRRLEKKSEMRREGHGQRG